MNKHQATISHFTVRVPYIVTTFEELNRLGTYEIESPNQYAWTFPMANYERVKALLNADIEISPAPLLLAIRNCPSLKDTVKADINEKGKGHCIITFSSPEIIEVQYVESGEIVEREVPRAVVKRFYDIAIAPMEKNRPYQSREVAETVIRDYPLDRFKRESGSPDANKFYGTRNNTGYFGYFYLPLKVLQALGIVQHTRSKKVIRIGEWTDTKFDNARFYDKEVWLWGDRLPVDVESDAE